MMARAAEHAGGPIMWNSRRQNHTRGDKMPSLETQGVVVNLRPEHNILQRLATWQNSRDTMRLMHLVKMYIVSCRYSRESSMSCHLLYILYEMAKGTSILL